MTWLITGGCGFVGTNLADALLSQGEAVVILDNLSRLGSRSNLAWLRQEYGNEWRFIESDIRDTEGVAHLVQEIKPKAIAHLAGQVAMTTSIADPRLDFEVNALGTFNILEAVRLHSPTTVVLYSSTNKVYGSLNHLNYQETEKRYILVDYPSGLDESLSLHGYSPYGCSKLTAEQYVQDYYRIYNIPTVVFRHSSMYGSRQFSTFDQGWIGWFCQKALEAKKLKNSPFTISGNGKQVRDVLYSQDLVKIYLLAVEKITLSAGKVYNIGGGVDNSFSLLELFDYLEELIGCVMKFNRLDWRVGDQKVFIANIAKASQELGWLPNTDKKLGIKNMVEWLQEVNYSC